MKVATRTLACAAALMMLGTMASAQSNAPTNNLPDPYKRIANWAKMVEAAGVAAP